MMRTWRAMVVVMVGTAALGMGMAQACSVDGVPSLSVDGRLVARNATLTSSAAVDTWTPFIARGAYPARHMLVLREDRARVATALPPEAFRFPWRWRFGDGATARGLAVRHAYRHAGTYIVTVEAYLVAGTQKLWFTFDKATIHVS